MLEGIKVIEYSSNAHNVVFPIDNTTIRVIFLYLCIDFDIFFGQIISLCCDWLNLFLWSWLYKTQL